MAIEVWIKRTKLGTIMPANSQSEQELSKLPVGEWHLAVIRKPRNVKHHRKWMALLQVCFPHQDMWPTFDSFRKAIQVVLGHGEVIEAKDGRKYIEAASISFAKMDQDEFEQFYERGVKLVLEKILPGVDRADLDAQVHEILEGRKEAA
ncbi:DUF1367 family protein [Henriciella pelagia]|uniref:DUF1367 family protein n=1 Tax=Henriciella pelagia TaxID=1977912 RepID=UPI0035130EF5